MPYVNDRGYWQNFHLYKVQVCMPYIGKRQVHGLWQRATWGQKSTDVCPSINLYPLKAEQLAFVGQALHEFLFTAMLKWLKSGVMMHEAQRVNLTQNNIASVSIASLQIMEPLTIEEKLGVPLHLETFAFRLLIDVNCTLGLSGFGGCLWGEGESCEKVLCFCEKQTAMSAKKYR